MSHPATASCAAVLTNLSIQWQWHAPSSCTWSCRVATIVGPIEAHVGMNKSRQRRQAALLALHTD